jgi:uncharacterized protein
LAKRGKFLDPSIIVSKSDARRIILYSQGLMASQPSTMKTPSGVVGQLSYIQIDTISVIARAHDHILWNRHRAWENSSYRDLLKDKSVFEYWSHAASYLPMKDYRFSLPRKQLFVSGKWHWFTPTTEHKKLRSIILKRIEKEGALSTKDFEAPKRKKSGWFEWKPAKQMLEQLFMEGKLMIESRQGFQKIYNLTERVLPKEVDQRIPSDQEFAQYLIFSHLRAQGIMSVEEISYLRSHSKKIVSEECAQLLKKGILISVEVDKRKYLALAESWDELVRSAKSSSYRNLLLSPFDNLLIRRKRFEHLFDFSYTLECYVPEKKRKYGYFCLPAMIDGNVVGVVDLKVDRKQKNWRIASFHSVEKKQKKEILKIIHPTIDELGKFSLKNPS